jgi:hypothetical protein
MTLSPLFQSQQRYYLMNFFIFETRKKIKKNGQTTTD